MDFQIPPPVTEVLQKNVSHAIYGYTESNAEYFAAVQNWFATQHNFHIQEDWVVKTPGIMFALAMAIKAFTQPGDAILIQKPLYYPIEGAIRDNRRAVIDNTLVYENGRYTVNMADFEQKIKQNNVRIFVLCNPHNPVGRVWTRDELGEMACICKKYNCLVVSDEVHCDLLFGNRKHIVFTEFDESAIILTSPSKTFNLAGLQISNAFIPNAKHRELFKHEIAAAGYSQLNGMGIIACAAAYNHGHEWLAALLDYLSENAAYVKNFLAEKMPSVRAIDLEGTYLMWLDFNELGLSQEVLQEKFDSAKVWLSSGTAFGETGRGFWRINIACPRATLKIAMERLENALVKPY